MHGNAGGPLVKHFSAARTRLRRGDGSTPSRSSSLGHAGAMVGQRRDVYLLPHEPRLL